jgi:hypothetical protein
MQALSDVFGARIIISGIWAARSPNLILVIFFFCGCLKDKVYNSNPTTGMKEYISKEIANSPAEQFERANQNLFSRCEECLRVKGQHFQHFL